MRKSSSFIVNIVLLMAFSGAWQSVEAQVPSELVGGWIVTSWTSADGEVDDSPQRGLFIFAPSGHYSMMYVSGDEPRPTYEGEEPTEAEVISAYDSFIANSGRFSVNGDRLMYEAYMAKDTNYMDEFNAQEPGNGVNVEFSIADGVLTLHWLDGFQEGQTATLRRPGQG
jgi:hypothetical protein